jgi:hypothetical protein
MNTFISILLSSAFFASYCQAASVSVGIDSNDEDGIHVVCSPSQDGFVVFVPHPYDCAKFFMCHGMTGVAMDCPGSLQFDTDLNVCNYESLVNCVNTPYPTKPTTPTQPTDRTTTESNQETTTEEDDVTTLLPEDELYQDYFL